MAQTIPGARFVELPGNSHALVAGTPAFDRFVEEATAFIAAHGG